jgi:outer membrane receptor protein involved in Fe transport
MRLRLPIRWSFPLFVLAASFFWVNARAQGISQGKNVPIRQAQGATIQGTVFDPDGRAVPGARVTLLRALAPVEERQTDSHGEYRFEGLRGGSFVVVASLPGFSKLSAKVELRGDEVRTIDLRLELSAVEEQVIVSASLGGALAPQIGSSVSVISRQEIENRGAQNVYDVLRGVPGVEINQSDPHSPVASAFIRGGNSNYNLVMVDGIPLNDFGGGFDFSPIPADGVDRVEVIRGPQSALYGSNAVAGVINVVTQRGEGPPHFSFLAEGGSHATRRFATGGTGLHRGFGWAYSLSRLDSGGPVVNDDYRNQSSFVSLGYSRSPRRQVNLHFFGDAADGGAPGPYGSDPDQLFPGLDTVSRSKQNLFGYQANYSEQLSQSFRQVTTVSVATNHFFFHSPFGDSSSNNLRVVTNTRSEIAVSEKDFFVAGFEYDHEQFRNTFIADTSGVPFLLPRANFAYFAENRWNPGSRWFLNTGVRVDDIRTGSLPPDGFGARPFLAASAVAKVNPRISIAFLARQAESGGTWGATRLHGSFGTGIRPPDGFELGFTNNPNLKPEKSISFDAGVEQRLASDRAVLDITYFYNRFTDQIVTLGGSLQNLSTFSSANLANARAHGLETSLRLRPARSLEVIASYTWLNSSILALDGTTLVQFPFQVGQPLIRRPRNSAGYNITWTHRRLMLNLNGTIRGAVLDLEPNDGNFACVLGMPCLFRNKGYVAANGGFAYGLPRGVEIYGRLNNFLNQKYEESFGFPALRLNFTSGIRFRFPAERAHAATP